MRFPAELTADSIAVCGMPCFSCWKYCANSKPCPGCRVDGKNKPRGCRQCAVKDCAAEQGHVFCFDCPSYPCRLIKNLERNYKRYDFSFITYGRFAQTHGAAALLTQYRSRFTCPHCGGVLSLHDRICTTCGAPPPAVSAEDS